GLAPATPRPPLFPYTTLFRSRSSRCAVERRSGWGRSGQRLALEHPAFVVVVVKSGTMACLTWWGVCPYSDAAYTRYVVSVRKLRSEEHTSELQSREKLVCSLL